MSNCEVSTGVIYDWKTMVEMICEKGVLSLEWKREGVVDGDSGDTAEKGDLAWPRKWDCESKIETCGWESRNDWGSWRQR